jgi:hypothetical protein
MKEEQRDYVSTVIASIVRGINVVRGNDSTCDVKRNKIKN